MSLGCTAACQAHLRGHSGRNGLALAHSPTVSEFTIPPHLFRTLLLERLRLPLQFGGNVRRMPGSPGHGGSPPTERQGEATCRTERMTARVFREAGACVRQNVFLRDMNVNVPTRDSRHIEVLAQNLPCFGGVQLTVDITLRSSLTCNGKTHPHAAEHDGPVLAQARQDKGVPTRFFWPVQARGARH